MKQKGEDIFEQIHLTFTIHFLINAQILGLNEKLAAKVWLFYFHLIKEFWGIWGSTIQSWKLY